MKLYYHKTDGGAEYLTDAFIECQHGHKEGSFTGAKYVVRLDGDYTRHAELSVSDTTKTDLLVALEKSVQRINQLAGTVNHLSNKLGLGQKVLAEHFTDYARAAIAKAAL